MLVSAEVRRQWAAEPFGEILGGRLRPRIAERFPIAEGAVAHKFLESRAAIGRVLLSL